MNFIYEISNYIADNTSLVLGDSLMIGELTRGKTGVYAIQGQGAEPDKYTDTKYVIIDFWAKYKKTDNAFSILEEIYGALHQTHDIQLPDYYLYYCNALGSVTDFDRDIEEMKMLKQSFNFIYK